MKKILGLLFILGMLASCGPVFAQSNPTQGDTNRLCRTVNGRVGVDTNSAPAGASTPVYTQGSGFSWTSSAALTSGLTNFVFVPNWFTVTIANQTATMTTNSNQIAAYNIPNLQFLNGVLTLSQLPVGSSTNFVFTPNWLTVTQSGGVITLNTNSNTIAANTIPNLSSLNGAITYSQAPTGTVTNWSFTPNWLTVTQSNGSVTVTTNSNQIAAYNIPNLQSLNGAVTYSQLPAGVLTNATMIAGGGTNVIASVGSGVATLKGFLPGTSITISDNGTNLTINSTAGGGNVFNNANNTFTSASTNWMNSPLYFILGSGTNQVTTASLTGNRTFTLPDANSNPVQPSTAPANQFATAIAGTGAITWTQPSFSNLSGTATSAQLPTDVAYTDKNGQIFTSNNTFNLKPILVSGYTVSNANGSASMFIDVSTGFPQFNTSLEASGFNGDGSQLTGITFTQIGGRATVAQVPTNTALTNQDNNFTSQTFNGAINQTNSSSTNNFKGVIGMVASGGTNFITSSTLTGMRTFTLPDANSNPVQPSTAPANQFATAISGAGAITWTQPSFSNLSGSATYAQLPANSGTNFVGAGGLSTSFSAGTWTLTQGAGTSYASSLVSTNLTGWTSDSGGNKFAVACTITTTATSGNVTVIARALSAAAYAGNTWCRIRDASTNVCNQVGWVGMGTGGTPYSLALHDTLSGSAKTYYFEIASSGVSQVFTNYLASGVGLTGSSITNAFGMTCLQNP